MPFEARQHLRDLESLRLSLAGSVVYFILYNKQHPILQVPNVMYGTKYPCQLIATLPM